MIAPEEAALSMLVWKWSLKCEWWVDMSMDECFGRVWGQSGICNHRITRKWQLGWRVDMSKTAVIYKTVKYERTSWKAYSWRCKCVIWMRIFRDPPSPAIGRLTTSRSLVTAEPKAETTGNFGKDGAWRSWLRLDMTPKVWMNSKGFFLPSTASMIWGACKTLGDWVAEIPCSEYL